MSDKMKGSLETFHDYGVYDYTNTVEIFGDIDKDMCDRTIKNLHMLDNNSGKTITILLKSPGGCVTQGLAIHDAIRYCKNLVRIIGIGGIESMATVILQAGDERLLYKNSYFMIHEGNSTLEGNQKDITQQQKLHKIQEDLCNKIYLEKIKNKKPRYTMKKLIDLMDCDRILMANEIVELGLADKIIEGSY